MGRALIVTEAVSSAVGRGVEPAPAAEGAKLEPKIEMIEPGATGAPAAKLAPLTIPPGAIKGVPGVTTTRKTGSVTGVLLAPVAPTRIDPV